MPGPHGFGAYDDDDADSVFWHQGGQRGRAHVLGNMMEYVDML